jgi:hypothetical protein
MGQLESSVTNLVIALPLSEVTCWMGQLESSVTNLVIVPPLSEVACWMGQLESSVTNLVIALPLSEVACWMGQLENSVTNLVIVPPLSEVACWMGQFESSVNVGLWLVYPWWHHWARWLGQTLECPSRDLKFKPINRDKRQNSAFEKWWILTTCHYTKLIFINNIM